MLKLSDHFFGILGTKYGATGNEHVASCFQDFTGIVQADTPINADQRFQVAFDQAEFEFLYFL